jgi:hypothetical protein
MAITLTINLNILKKDFRHYDVLKGIDTFERVSFRKTVDYFGLLVKRKKMEICIIKTRKENQRCRAVGVKVKGN